MVDEDILVVVDDDGEAAQSLDPWLVLVVDDDPEVHGATRVSLANFQFHGRPLRILSCYSAKEAYRTLADTADVACVLLDVVMEDEHAGLDLARRIRDDLGNHMVRIVLRTGQPGYAPELEVITAYDINDYKAKTELTAVRLASTLITALRSYEQLIMINDLRHGLEMVIRASADLFCERNIKDFAAGVVMQLAAQMGVPPEGVLCTSMADGRMVIVAGAGRFSGHVLHPVEHLGDPGIERVIFTALAERSNVFLPGSTAFFLQSATARPAVVYVKGDGPTVDEQRHLLQLFCMNIALGFETAQLFERLKETAYVDPLTQLPNRAGFLAAIGAAGIDHSFAVIIVDIDQFHDISRHLGFLVGDSLLRAAAARLKETFPDAIAIARLSSDQFALALGPVDLKDAAGAVLRAFDAPLSFCGLTTQIGVTGGSTTAFASVPNPGEIYLYEASRAMKEAKRRARGQILPHNPALDNQSHKQLVLINDLRRGIQDDEIRLHFQPKVDLATGTGCGVEALVRWRSNRLGLIYPDTFIPIAEVSGLILSLGSRVFELGLRQRKDWLSQGVDIPIAINVSAVQIQQADFLQTIDTIAAEVGVDSDGIEIEITETSLLGHDPRVLDHLAALRDRGYGLALDDFGTGYSSLSQLHLLPLTTLKIDRCFVSTLTESAQSSTLVSAIVGVAHSMHVHIVAEGIETEGQNQRLRELGVEIGQGYLFGRPMEAIQLKEWWSGNK